MADDTKAMAADAKQFASRHGISISKIIELGSHIISGVIALMSGQPVDETFTVRLKGVRFTAHALVQLTPPRFQFSLEPAA
jgi:hypothetical protein